MKKTIFITGTSTGFGREAAKLFQQHGWNVIATMRNPDKETELQQLENVFVTRLDVQDQASITQAVNEGLNRFGHIDVLINNAGYSVMGAFESSTHEQLLQMYNVNVFGLMDVTRAILPYMREQGHGTIINLSSIAGVLGFPFGSPYVSSKFAVEGFSESLHHELKPINIFVKLIEPGSVDTNFRNNVQMINNEIAAYNEYFATFMGNLSALTAPMQPTTAADVAQLIYEVATDNTDRLRYMIGEDAEFYISKKNNQQIPWQS